MVNEGKTFTVYHTPHRKSRTLTQPLLLLEERVTKTNGYDSRTDKADTPFITVRSVSDSGSVCLFREGYGIIPVEKPPHFRLGEAGESPARSRHCER